MKSRPRIWFLVSVSLFIAAALVWRFAEEKEAARRAAAPKAPAAVAPSQPVVTSVHTNQSAVKAKHQGPYRLSNTPLTAKQLARNEHGILLRNALIDTARPVHLDIPEHLRSHGAPGSYIVQSDRPVNAEFMAAVQRDGAEYVSYIPNNAALVNGTPDAAQKMMQDPVFQAVLPYEPYYKLDAALLPEAVNQESQSNSLSVTTYPGQRDAALKALENLGAKLIGEDRSPFGPTLVVSVPADTLVAVAQLPQAQEIERFTPRHVLNDLTRVTLSVAANTLIGTPNYMNLTGQNIWVNLNDTGVDGTHPDFGSGQLVGDPNDPTVLTDNEGHGTHVAGIIMGNGTKSASVVPVPPGSVTGADFRGKAPKASLFVQSLDLLAGPFVSDAYLQTNASMHLRSNAMATGAAVTNGFISNNSWGYADTAYDMHSASFDQAVRDAEPEIDGEQSMTYVFAAGNNGQLEDSINSPGTAKNVITVGASDCLRNITNLVSLDGQTTNEIFLTDTSSANQIASFSSGGNTDVGVEGQYGRFKPDVVAPGVFIISTRSSTYVDPTTDETVEYGNFPQQIVNPGQTNIYGIDLPTNAVALIVQVVPNSTSPVPFPNMPVWIDQNNPPVTLQGSNYVVVPTVVPGNWYVGVGTPTNYNQPISYDMNTYIIETNYLGDYFTVLSNLNAPLRPYYMYDSGTSMSAGAVSGVLALMQEYLSTHGTPSPSPALLKALLIQGSSSINNTMDFNTQPTGANLQGWGLVNLQNSLPPSLTNGQTSLVFMDQSVTNALATGQSWSYQVNLPDGNATNYPLRFTLVWTDPPGNPAAGIALVNNLDLIVTDSTGTNIYIGNDFQAGDIFTEVSASTNEAAADIVNNVENVYIDTSVTKLLPPYTVTVMGSRVNVNAVTTQTNDIKQDFVLVISSDDQAPTQALTVTDGVSNNVVVPLVTVANSGVPLLHQRVGANEPDVYNYATGSTNGVKAQWHFFVFTNTVAATNVNATNVIFATFMPPDLSIPRVTDADIDLYASTDSGLTNLDSTVIFSSSTQKSLNRGGNEVIVYTNSTANEVYYIGVKSEDQQAADFGFYAVATDSAGSPQTSSNATYTAMSLPVAIPDGSYDNPQSTNLLAFSSSGVPTGSIRKITATVGILHQNPGDLLGTITYGGSGGTAGGANTQVLNNHSSSAPGFTNLYDSLPDGSDSTTYPVLTPDYPGNLTNYVGKAMPVNWMLIETDNALTHVGSNEVFTVVADKHMATNNFIVTIAGGGWFYDYIAVPNDATNLSIAVTFESGSGPVTLYLDPTNYPVLSTVPNTNVNAPGGQLSINTNSAPVPLRGGQWYYGIFNGSASSVTLDVVITIEESLTPNLTETFYNTNATPLLTDGHTVSQICITNGQFNQVVGLNVGVRISDTNLDDLVLHLTSPQGTSILLFEDRGGTAATNLGMTLGTNGNYPSNYVYTTFTENTNLAGTLIKFAPPPFAQQTGPTTNVTIFTNSFETNVAGTYGLTNVQITTVLGTNVEGWTVETNDVAVVTSDGTPPASQGTNYLALANGLISRTINVTNLQTYQLSVAYRGPGLTDWWPADGKGEDLVGANTAQLTDVTYVAGKVDQAWLFNGSNSVVNLGTTVGNFGTSDFTIDFWVNDPSPTFVNIMEKRHECDATVSYWTLAIGGPSVGNGHLHAVLSGNNSANFSDVTAAHTVIDGFWHHVAFVRTSTNISFYVDGALDGSQATAPADIQNTDEFHIGPSVCVGQDTRHPFAGAIDELGLWSRALSLAEINAIYNAGSQGKRTVVSVDPNIQIVAENRTNTIIAAPNSSWNTNVFAFTATNTGNATITIQGNPLGMLLDNIQCVALPFTNYNNYFLPEESLSPLVGENGIGCWTLDVWDTRQDSISTNNGVLLAWNVNMTFSSTNVTLIVLTNQVPYSNSVPANSTAYFAFDVPSAASFVTNLLTNVSPPLTLLFNQTGLPTGTQPGDIALLANVTGANSYTLSNSFPPLQPGQRYFLGLQNQTAAAVTYSLEAAADVSTNVPVIALTNSLYYTNTILATSAPQYYSFDVPEGASLAAFEVMNPTDDIDLYVRHALPLPDTTTFDYVTTYSGTNDEAIVVTSNSVPVPLTPGTWYASVYNYNAANPVTYVVRASYLTNSLTNVPYVTTLTNGLNGLLPSNQFSAFPGAATNFYAYTVTNNPQAVEFIITNVSGNLDLLVQDGIVPTPQEFYEASFNSNKAPQIVIITTNSSLPTLTNTTWYLGLPNNQTNATTFSIFVTNIGVATNNFPLVRLSINASILSPTNGVAMNWIASPGEKFAVDISSNLMTWTNFTNITLQTTNGGFTDPTPIDTQSRRYYRLRRTQ